MNGLPPAGTGGSRRDHSMGRHDRTMQ